MSIIKLEASNESSYSKALTALAFEFLERKSEQSSLWQYYKIIFYAGDKQISFVSQRKQATTYTGTESEIGKFAFAVKPHNEFQEFCHLLNKFLDSNQNSFRFEPADPSFELLIEKINTDPSLEEYKVYCWIDTGNTNQLEYSWDGLGIRFVTNKDRLKLFYSGCLTLT